MTAHEAGAAERLDGARAMVTGASRGIGAAIAVALARAGADVAVCARTRPHLLDTARQVEATGRRAIKISGDFSAPTAAADAVNQAAVRLGGLDVVVHCAGVLPTQEDGTPKVAPFAASTSAEWEYVTRVNLLATVTACRAARPHLAASDRASLILVSSVAGLIAVPGMEAYGATKAAQVSLARSLGAAWARDGIRVNALCPGWVETDMTAFAAETKPLSDWLMAHVPQGRWLTPEDVAPSALYLATGASAGMTGQTLVIDGGLSVADGGLAGIPKPPSPFVPEGA